jgi:hypothetical protein
VDAVGGGEELDRVGLDLLGDAVHALLVRGCRGAGSRRLVALDGVLGLVERVGGSFACGSDADSISRNSAARTSLGFLQVTVS